MLCTWVSIPVLKTWRSTHSLRKITKSSQFRSLLAQATHQCLKLCAASWTIMYTGYMSWTTTKVPNLSHWPSSPRQTFCDWLQSAGSCVWTSFLIQCRTKRLAQHHISILCQRLQFYPVPTVLAVPLRLLAVLYCVLWCDHLIRKVALSYSSPIYSSHSTTVKRWGSNSLANILTPLGTGANDFLFAFRLGVLLFSVS